MENCKVVDFHMFNGWCINLVVRNKRICVAFTYFDFAALMYGYPDCAPGSLCDLKLESYENGWVALKVAANGIERYVSVDRDSECMLRACATSVGVNELFKFHLYPEYEAAHEFYIRTFNGEYVTMHQVTDVDGRETYVGGIVPSRKQALRFCIADLFDPDADN